MLFRSEFLGGEAQCDQHELQVVPIGLEPDEQVDAEDDRKLPEADGVAVPVRPREQHVERIRERQLRGHQRNLVVHQASKKLMLHG